MSKEKQMESIFTKVSDKGKFMFNSFFLMSLGVVLFAMSDDANGRNIGVLVVFFGVMLLVYSSTDRVKGKDGVQRRNVSIPWYENDIQLPGPYVVTLLSVFATILVYAFDAPMLQVPSLVLTGIAVVWSGYYIVERHKKRVS